MKSTTGMTKLIKGMGTSTGRVPVPLGGKATGCDPQLKETPTPRCFLVLLLVLSALLIHPLSVVAQSAGPARTFAGGPLSVTMFDGTGLNSAETNVQFPMDVEDGTEIINIPVEVTGAPQRRSFLVVQFVGYFSLPPNPATIALDCVINHEINVSLGCGITPATDLAVIKNGIDTLIPATFLIRDLPSGTHQIGIMIYAHTQPPPETPPETPPVGRFYPAHSSLIVSLYAEKK